MTDLIAHKIPNLPTEMLLRLAEDAHYRIGSHVAGGMPVDAYVEKQRKILSLIQDELANR